MNSNDIQLLFEYDRWANAQLLNAVSELKPEEFVKDLGSSHRSVRDTLTHLISAEWIWLTRWKGSSPRALWDPNEFPDLSSLKSKWTDTENDLKRFVSEMTEEQLTGILEYVNTRGETWRYPLWQTMEHLANHSTYHRGQIITMLRQLGARVPTTDFLVFFDVTSGSGPVKP
jgi:uncharacterized damage-inducible protein DinB